MDGWIADYFNVQWAFGRVNPAQVQVDMVQVPGEKLCSNAADAALDSLQILHLSVVALTIADLNQMLPILDRIFRSGKILVWQLVFNI